MAVVNIHRTKLIEEVRTRFPNLLKPENMADVIIAAVELYALDSANGKSKWWFVNKGAKPHAVYDAYQKNILEKRKAPRFRLLMYKRGKAPSDKYELHRVLNFERQGLYTHLTVSSTARKAVADILNLKTSSVSAIKKEIERGTIQEQVDVYDKIVTKLGIKKLYNKNYNYYWLGFRFLPDKYWLSSLGQKLLARAKA